MKPYKFLRYIGCLSGILIILYSCKDDNIILPQEDLISRFYNVTYKISCEHCFATVKKSNGTNETIELYYAEARIFNAGIMITGDTASIGIIQANQERIYAEIILNDSTFAKESSKSGFSLKIIIPWYTK